MFLPKVNEVEIDCIADCGGAEILRIIKIVWEVLDVALFIIPMILIVMVSLDFAKSVIANKEDDMKKNASIAIKRMIYCVVLFLLPYIADIAIGLVSDTGIKAFACVEYAKAGDLSQCEVDMSTDSTYEGETPNFSKDNDLSINNNNTNDNNNNTNDNSNSVNNNNDNNTSNNTLTNVFIGDSRCLGIQNALDTTEQIKSKWICKENEGYKWLTNTAINNLNDIVELNHKYNIIINLGVNDFTNISSYITYYNSLITQEKYQNSKLIIVSINTIDDTKASNNNYKAKNSSVIYFNNQLKTKLSNNITYCDVYNKIKDSYSTTDGLHYDNQTSKNIYNEILNCL